MPRKRRSPVTEDAAESSSKRVKREPAPALVTRWEWENDGNKWTAYDAALSAEMSSALTAGQQEVELQLPKGVKLKVIFKRMVQKNKVTGWERRMRCCVQDGAEAGTDFYCWEWEDEKGNWNPYSADVAQDLERSQAAGETSVSFAAYNRDYTVDVPKMEQTNDDTKVIRKVRRVKSAAVPPDAGVKVEMVESNKASTSTAENGAAASGRKASGATKKSGATTKSGATKGEGAKSGRSVSGKVKTEPGEPAVKTVILKGKAPVDSECIKQDTAHVYCEGNDIYDVMLNQTNLQNNNNKFFIIQLLEDDNRKIFSVWFRWGRVGVNGQNNLIPCGPDLDEAKAVFCKKFSDKTKNDWSDRKKFKKVPGKYDLLQIDYNVKSDDEGEEDDAEESKKASKRKPTDVPDSKLDKRLQALIQLICNVRTMEEAIVEMKYDAKKMPLGKLTAKQIKAGYSALKVVDKCISSGELGQKLLHACNDFYTRIPHCFGMRTPPLIRTKEDLKAKIQMLESLAEIEIAMKIIEQGAEAHNMNPIDSQYDQLKCGLQPLDRAHTDFNLVSRYVENTHAPTHNQYSMKVINVFQTQVKDAENDNFNDVGNRMLLWHGSRLTNWAGILSQGLRIAPPEAPVTGYMFGKGVYFADVSSKSANYCFATRTKNTGLLLLCEVALGKTNDLLAADYNAAELPAGKHSVKGLGALGPDPKDNHTTEDGVLVPQGKLTKTGVKNPIGYTLNYNEFIVYDTDQIRMKYLVEVQFNFK